MSRKELLDRLNAGHPGWSEYDSLLREVGAVDWEVVEEEYLGNYFVSPDSQLCFSVPSSRVLWPDWLPTYVKALVGLKAEEPAMAGGYADSFRGQPSESGSVFTDGVEDADLGYPQIEAPEGVYPFQTNSSGALFHVNRELNILYPNMDTKSLDVLDSLEKLTKTVIRESLGGGEWYTAYHGRDLDVFD